MNTLVLEIVNKNIPYKGFYNPAVEGFKVSYRSLKTRHNAFKRIVKTIKEHDFIDRFIIKEYEGKYEYYKHGEIIGEFTEDDLYDMELL